MHARAHAYSRKGPNARNVPRSRRGRRREPTRPSRHLRPSRPRLLRRVLCGGVQHRKRGCCKVSSVYRRHRCPSQQCVLVQSILLIDKRSNPRLACVCVCPDFPTVRVVFVVEPDGLANLVTNLSVPKCANAASTYKMLVSYAISKLQQPNVFLYLDAGHAGWLGWPANITPAAQLFGQVLAGAGAGAVVRGLATGT